MTPDLNSHHSEGQLKSSREHLNEEGGSNDQPSPTALQMQQKSLLLHILLDRNQLKGSASCRWWLKRRLQRRRLCLNNTARNRVRNSPGTWRRLFSPLCYLARDDLDLQSNLFYLLRNESRDQITENQLAERNGDANGKHTHVFTHARTKERTHAPLQRVGGWAVSIVVHHIAISFVVYSFALNSA